MKGWLSHDWRDTAASRGVATAGDIARELQRYARDIVRCDVCDKAPERVDFEPSPVDGTHRALAWCSHGAADPKSVGFYRTAKRDVIVVDDEQVIMQPRTWRGEFVFFRRGFSCYPREPRRGGVRPLPAFERRAMRRR